MKKQNAETNEQTNAKQKRIKKEHKFFLYVDGKGLIRLPKEVGAVPNFTDGDILTYTSRISARYAQEFFISIKLADSIDIVSKVA